MRSNASNVEVVRTGYSPRPLQQKLHVAMKRFNVLVCHRRFGKTVFSINELIDRSLRNTRKNPQYAYFAPFYSQAKKVAWDYLKEYTKHMPNVKVNESELTITIFRRDRDDRVKIMLMGADNIDAARGMYFDGVILDEYADMDPQIWTKVLRPALSDRMGWAIFIGTPKGQNHFYDVFLAAKRLGKEWFTAVYKASETGIIPKTELEANRAIMSEDEYEQEYECSFAAALTGAYYGKQMEKLESQGRITKVPYDPALAVDTFWDLGMDDSTAIWMIQHHRFEFRVINYIEDNGLGLESYVRMLFDTGYSFRRHYLPHDAAVRELGTGVSRQETLKNLGLRHITVLPKHNVADGISASRLVIPKCWFDYENCEVGINALKNYTKKWDAKNKVYMNTPLHNWASHGADAWRQFAMGMKPERDDVDVRRLPRSTKSDYDILGR